MMDLKILPVLQVLIIALMMIVANYFHPNFTLNLPENLWISLFIFLIAIALAIFAVCSFRQHKTTVNPMKPESSTTVVNTGVYAFSRNPMYLAMLIALIALAYYIEHLSSIPLLIVFVIYMTKFQIIPEEKALSELFGQHYLDYKTQVRRWL
jgi:protein-S-isoprenylcysteine O-methyltransferase Ste14